MAGRAKSETDGGISKSEAVRQAMSELGKKAMPKEIHDFVAERFGIEMSVNHISNIKSMMKKKKGGRRGRRPAAEAEAGSEAPRREPKATSRTGGGIAIEDVQKVKELAQRLGAKELNALVELLAK